MVEQRKHTDVHARQQLPPVRRLQSSRAHPTFCTLKKNGYIYTCRLIITGKGHIGNNRKRSPLQVPGKGYVRYITLMGPGYGRMVGLHIFFVRLVYRLSIIRTYYSTVEVARMFF